MWKACTNELVAFTNVFAMTMITITTEITMIYLGPVIDKMVEINKNTLVVKSEKKVYSFIANKLLMSVNSVIDL